MKGFTMNLILRKLFPKTMRQQYFLGHAKGRNYGVYLAVTVLHEEMKQVHKDTEVPSLTVNARSKAKYLQTLIRKVKALNVE
jgi:hypothetical protein